MKIIKYTSVFNLDVKNEKITEQCQCKNTAIQFDEEFLLQWV